MCKINNIFNTDRSWAVVDLGIFSAKWIFVLQFVYIIFKAGLAEQVY